MGEAMKQVRVDNWGIFFLQRLQIFFNKTDYCDLTLQFEGNVQLKVHRLVVNACTQYFQILEQTCEMMAEDTIIMPADLQADVVLPIVNFMYTGMLEFHVAIYEKLYKTACLMNITVLTKLLDAQRVPIISNAIKKSTQPVAWTIPEKTFVPKVETDYSSRKLSAWKRKNIAVQNKNISHIFTEEKRQTLCIDPLATVDSTPKPTRFDWPDADLPEFNMFETDFNEISYSNTPIMVKSEEPQSSTSLDFKTNNEDEDFENSECDERGNSKESNKRKLESETVSVKRVRFNTREKENKSKSSAKISITPSGKSSSLDIDHTKIITEVLKKYPSLIKKNQNVRLKILAKNNGSSVSIKKASPGKLLSPEADTLVEEKNEKGPWQCKHCSSPTEPFEFALYYLYRKHMTDVHFEKFDSRMCKFCGHKSTKHNLLMYHQYTKHGVKPPLAYNFPKCDQCSFIALNDVYLAKHKAKHSDNELQCVNCNVTFSNQQALNSHIKITGHTGKLSKPTYDCQYCTTQCPSSIMLFAHLRQQHRDEARRDGIVSIDEIVDEEEYVLPEHINDIKRDKVKILSDVKLPNTVDTAHQTVSLEPSSEAEALNNVATGIATSLGLVDVVVIDDNQQYILHAADNEQDMSGPSEFILPDIQDTQDFATAHEEVVSSGSNITMLHNADISSTDELVMVLTDQDYNNEHNQILDGDHSNIVVLYSHPVDCQDNQFLPTGNIVLSSQSGIIELQNTNTFVTSNIPSFMTTTPSQISESTEIESIELIQREIDGDSRAIEIPITNDVNFQTVALSDQNNIDSGESENHEDDIRKQSFSSENTSSAAISLEENVITMDNHIDMNSSIVNSPVINSVDAVVSESNTGDVTIMVESQNTAETEEKSFEQIPANANSDEITRENVEEELAENVEEELAENVEEEPAENVEEVVEQPQKGENDTQMEWQRADTSCSNTTIESHAVQQPIENQEIKSVTNMQEDSSEAQEDNIEITTTGKVSVQPLKDNSQPTEQALESQDIENASEANMSEIHEELPETEEANTMDSQNSLQKSENESHQTKKTRNVSKKALVKSGINKKTAKTILDDWEDTNSPQSVSNVHKIIDDWDDEDDESKRSCE